MLLDNEKRRATRIAHFSLAAAATITLATAPAVAVAAYRDDIGYTDLQAELGSATPTGASVVITQTEGSVLVNGTETWMPDVNIWEFNGKTITNESGAPAGLYSGHATAVGTAIYGSITAIAPAPNTIAVYGADPWLGAGFLWATGTRRPATSTSRIGNHSWIGDAGGANSDVLRRFDWVIENDDMIQVTGIGNGSGGAATTQLLAGTFNSIAPGVSSGMNQVGTVYVDADYPAGRVRPDVVIPAINTSLAAANTSSAVALLIETGHANAALSTDPVSTSYTNRAGLLIRNAERVEVIRAALMAGADRVTHNTTTTDLGLYRAVNYRSGNGLDTRYGAGQVNVRNSHHILASGEQNSAEDGGPQSGTASRGFDYDRYFGGSSSNSTATYALPVSSSPRVLTASLVVTLDIDGGTQNGSQSTFDGTATFRDLSLSVLNVANPGNPVTVVTSQSTVETTEHVWLVVPPNAQYALRVARVGGTSFSYDYGVAWQLLTDTDSDGAPDEQDDCISVANGPLATDAGGRSQFDGDGDGYGNACDGDLNNSGMVTSADFTLLRSALNTSDATADLNGSGLVTTADYNILRAMLNTAPGPSGLLP